MFLILLQLLFSLDIFANMLYNTLMKKYIIILIFAVLLFLGGYACPIYNTIGIPCPGCGMTRAYKLLFSGKIYDAFIMHPLFLLPPFFLIKPLRKKWYLILATILFIIVYIIRMTTMFPHTPPMDYNYNSTLGVLLK